MHRVPFVASLLVVVFVGALPPSPSAAAEGRRFRFNIDAPRLLDWSRAEPPAVRVLITCPYPVEVSPCRFRVVLHVRAGAHGPYRLITQNPPAPGGAELSFAFPDDIGRDPRGVTYFLTATDLAHGQTQRRPVVGKGRPPELAAWPVDGVPVVRLPRLGRKEVATRVVAVADWGTGPDEVSRTEPGAVHGFGVSGFDVTRRGRVAVLDVLAPRPRVLWFRPGERRASSLTRVPLSNRRVGNSVTIGPRGSLTIGIWDYTQRPIVLDRRGRVVRGAVERGAQASAVWATDSGAVWARRPGRNTWERLESPRGRRTRLRRTPQRQSVLQASDYPEVRILFEGTRFGRDWGLTIARREPGGGTRALTLRDPHTLMTANESFPYGTGAVVVGRLTVSRGIQRVLVVGRRGVIRNYRLPRVTRPSYTSGRHDEFLLRGRTLYFVRTTAKTYTIRALDIGPPPR